VSAVTARSTLAAVGGDRVRALAACAVPGGQGRPDQTVPSGGGGGRRRGRLLDELAAELEERRYRSLPARRVFIPKPGSGERRPLSIPSVHDRIVQAAVRIVLEPIFEADMLACSFGFRPRRSAHDALQVLIDESWQGRRWVVETDIANCFEAIPHAGLLQAIEERGCDRAVLSLMGGMLGAGVMEAGSLRRGVAGTPQGGVVSPLLANIYLHRLDRAWSSGQHGVLVRFADDVVVMCRSRGQAEAALERLTVLLAELGLQPKAAKTRVVHLAEGGEGFDFLGFHHRLVRGRTPRSAHLTFLARWPARKAVQRARDRIREITGRKWLWMPVEDIVRDLNLFLRGWANYFRYGNSARVLGQIRNYALQRLAIWLSKKGNRRRAWRWGLKQLLLSPNQMGLISLDGTVVAPRPFRDWRGKQGTERRR
jgi:group II intron reverse transcriptase/maturase